MKTHALYPLTLIAQYRDYIWGGHTIAERYNRAGTPTPCAESWEISAVPGAASVIAQGAFEGIALDRIVQTFGRDFLGSAAPDPERFPLLIKILDAQTRLSVQVHPDAPTAAALGGQPKHEMWYVLAARHGAQIYAGLTEGATPETVVEHLAAHATSAGDVFDIPAGCVHAIDAGNLIYEVQQTSDTTYRLHDWGRGRELHLENALRSIHWELTSHALHAQSVPNHPITPRLVTPEFNFATLDLTYERTLQTTARSFMVLFCASGKTTLSHEGPHPLTLQAGDTVLLPAKSRVVLNPLAKTRLLMTTL
ncbi:MAG: type I phosphomannose isomerase catalytic subunit [Kiritimatiellia bacterium]